MLNCGQSGYVMSRLNLQIFCAQNLPISIHEKEIVHPGKLRQEMEKFYQQAGLSVPTIKELYARFPDNSTTLIREILEVMVREGVAVKVSEELYFHVDTLAGLQNDLVEFVRDRGEIDAQGFKSLTGLSRKFSIPLLEHFDKAKVTLRIGDKRVLRDRYKQ